MPAGPAPTTATRSRGGGDGQSGSSSADTTRILSRPGGRAPGSGNPESRRQPVSVVATTTPPAGAPARGPPPSSEGPLAGSRRERARGGGQGRPSRGGRGPSTSRS